MSSYNYSPIIGQAETTFNQTATQGSDELDKLAFLNILVAQLQNQDPMNPMDDKEFTAQLAQFSSLEQLTNISEGIDTLNQSTQQKDMFDAVNFIGKEIRAEGYAVSKIGSKVSTLYFDLDETITGGFINVYDANGNMVLTEEMGARQAGTYEYVWDGKNYEGEEMDDGVYYIYMSAENTEGSPVLLYTDVSGKVSGVQSENGQIVLRLEDGRYVNYLQVKEVVNPSGSSAETEEDDTNAEEAA